MAAAAAGQVYLVTLVGSLNQQTIMNTFHYEIENVPAGGATVDQVYTALETFFELPNSIIDKYLLCLPDEYSLDQMWMQCVGPVQRFVKATALQGVNGTGGEGGRTSNLAGVITRTTEKAGRSQVSALHLPIGCTDTWIAGGSLQPAVRLAFQDLAALLDDQIGVAPALTLDPVIYHGPDGAPFTDQIIKATVQSTVRVMRRRTVGLGI